MMDRSTSRHTDFAGVGIPNFWRHIAAAPEVALLLDYDGTLAPFHVDRLKAVPLAGITDALLGIITDTDTSIALVSGRPIAEILSLMDDLGVTIIGTHGYEIRRPGESIRATLVDDTQMSILDRAERDARVIVGDDRAERKIATVAAHFRGLANDKSHELERELSELWMQYADPSSVEIRQFNGGLEMRSLGRHKGVAVAEYLQTFPAETVAVYIGDDETDEDAFRAVRDYDGYGIRVGDPIESTAALGSLSTCDDVLNFLQRWKKERTNQ